jgi:hypothetical protein
MKARDEKLSTDAIKLTMTALNKRITADEAQTDPEKKLAAKELVSLSNSMASLGRLLYQSDEDRLVANREGKAKGTFALFKKARLPKPVGSRSVGFP